MKSRQRIVAVDTETTGLHVMQGDRPFAVGMLWDDGTEEYYDWPVDPYTRKVSISTAAYKRVKKVMEDKNTIKVFHNANFDLLMLLSGFGIGFRGKIECSLIKAQVVLSGRQSYKLKALAHDLLGIHNVDERELKDAVKSLRRNRKIANTYSLGSTVEEDYWLPKHEDNANTLCRKYCLLDVKRTLLLNALLDNLIKGKKNKGIRKVYRREMKLLKVCLRMQQTGIRVDMSEIRKQIDTAKETAQFELEALQTYYNNMVGKSTKPFNPGSPTQVAKLLYDGAGLKIKKRTKSDNPSTDIEALRPYLDHPVVMSLLRWKAASKSTSSFFGKYLSLALADRNGDWYLYPEFRQNRAITGRMSMSEPNLQQVSHGKTAAQKGAVPIYARRPFIPRTGKVWLCADYSQLEARIFAYLAQEPTMLQAFADGRDMHAECADKCFGGRRYYYLGMRILMTRLGFTGTGSDPKAKDVLRQLGLHKQKKQRVRKWLMKMLYARNFSIVSVERELFGDSVARNRAKNILFLKTYGGGAYRASKEIGCSYDEAKELLSGYDTEFPKLKAYQRNVIAYAKEHRHINTLYGRRITVQNPFVYKGKVVDPAYKAVDYSIQSVAADLIKLAMIDIDKWCRRRKDLDIKMLLQVHDELIIEIAENHCKPGILRRIKDIMEDSHLDGMVATPVELSLCRKTWAEKEDVELN